MVEFFQFSLTQLKDRTAAEKRLGNKFIAGEVIVKGEPKLFTEITKTPEKKYPDAAIVASGERTAFKFTAPYSE